MHQVIWGTDQQRPQGSGCRQSLLMSVQELDTREGVMIQCISFPRTYFLAFLVTLTLHASAQLPRYPTPRPSHVSSFTVISLVVAFKPVEKYCRHRRKVYAHSLYLILRIEYHQTHLIDPDIPLFPSSRLKLLQVSHRDRSHGS